MQTVIFLTLVAQRALSGVQNGLGYAGSRHRYAASLALAVFSFLGILAAIIANLPAWQKGAAILAFAASQIGIGMVENAFAARQDGESLPKWRSDIHLWENFITAGFLFGAVLAGVNILLVVLSVYPGLILHKGAVNIGSGLRFFDARTDDASGKTYSLPFLGINVPRLSTRWRVALAMGSIAAAILAISMGWGLHFWAGKLQWI